MSMNEIALTPANTSFFYIIAAIVGTLLVGIVGLFVYLGYSLGHASLTIDDQALEIKAGTNSTRVPRSAIKSSEVRLVEPGSDPGLRTVRRTNGVALKSLRSGWFQLENGEKAFLWMTRDSRAVYVPTTEGYSLLVTPENPDQLLQAIRK